MNIYRGQHNVHIVPSAADFQTSVGLCGFIHEDRKAQFGLRDETVNGNWKTFSDNWWVKDDGK